ncbi:L-idonate 5-dehydrogenase [Schumannella luteola]|uniref:L-idonate 5-dehydrogenase n=1 Tax=Schumannella luteola TaxID=472059 RepID=A0A852YDE3_9MICO|nr:zinc-binding dehydrogenase [Schumannella luteola]NYG97657.1 L-idonate 5-dehydrogenase [Schumannella luteola]TPW90817.1 zinc-binding dehydrogenase [Schumannella luteola]
MRAVVARGAGDLVVTELPAPEVAADRLLVRIVYGGICGSDLHYAKDGRNGAYEIREPLVLGHEVVGVVESVGADAVTPQKVGDRVAIHPATPPPPPGGVEGAGVNTQPGGTYLGSASTWPHTQGGFTELLEVLPDQLRALPDELPLRRAALAEPLSVALHGVRRLGSVVEGAKVLVSGAGPIGSLAVAALKRAGAAHVTAADLQRAPLEVARRVGADAVVQLGVDPEPEPGSFDVVVEAAGVVPSLVSALERVRVGGTVLQLGMLPAGPLSVPIAGLIAREITLLGSQRFDIELDDAVRMLAEHPELDAVVSDEFTLDEVTEAFARAADSSRSCKVLLRIGDAE